MTNTQPPENPFLIDFLLFCRYAKEHRIRVTVLNHVIPLRHLKNIAARLKTREPFHPLHSQATYEMRSQRDQKRIDFMDVLAEELAILERNDMGYIMPARHWTAFMNKTEPDQIRDIAHAYWSMDWNGLYPHGETVDHLMASKKEILRFLTQCPPAQRIALSDVIQLIFRNGASSVLEHGAPAFFWVVIRPLEYLGLAVGYFDKDADGFFYPSEFELTRKVEAVFSERTNHPL